MVDDSIKVNDALTDYLDTTRTSLRCDIGRCLSLTELYDQFSSALCAEVVPGMDVYWSSLVILLSLSILLTPIGLLLASRFIDLDFQKGTDRSSAFHQSEAIVRQLRGGFWLIFSIAVDLWLVGAISNDEELRDRCAGSPGCCSSCIWGFGILFAILSILVGGASWLYQCVIIYRIKSEPHSSTLPLIAGWSVHLL